MISLLSLRSYTKKPGLSKKGEKPVPNVRVPRGFYKKPIIRVL